MAMNLFRPMAENDSKVPMRRPAAQDHALSVRSAAVRPMPVGLIPRHAATAMATASRVGSTDWATSRWSAGVAL